MSLRKRDFLNRKVVSLIASKHRESVMSDRDVTRWQHNRI